MSFDLEKILESKKAMRRRLAALPISEKLRMLDALRERELVIRGGAVQSDSVPDVRREDATSPPRQK